MIAPGIKRQQSPSRPNAIEERDILLRFEEARHPLVSCAMLPGNKSRAVDIARVAHLGGIRIALEQERLRPGAGGAQSREEQSEKEQRRSRAITGVQSAAASIND